MKKVLWCGGSHLANAKQLIQSKFSYLSNDFAVTAGDFHLQYLRGLRIYLDGSEIKGLEKFRPTNFNSYSKSDYELCIFVGQYIQPTRYFWDCTPLSNAVVSNILDPSRFLLDMRSGHAVNDFKSPKKYQTCFRNQPLELFSRLFAERLILIHDPLPLCLESYANVPLKYKERFNQSVVQFCSKNGIKLVCQPSHTVDQFGLTNQKFQRSESDQTHANDDFWDIILNQIDFR